MWVPVWLVNDISSILQLSPANILSPGLIAGETPPPYTGVSLHNG